MTNQTITEDQLLYLQSIRRQSSIGEASVTSDAKRVTFDSTDSNAEKRVTFSPPSSYRESDDDEDQESDRLEASSSLDDDDLAEPPDPHAMYRSALEAIEEAKSPSSRGVRTESVRLHVLKQHTHTHTAFQLASLCPRALRNNCSATWPHANAAAFSLLSLLKGAKWRACEHTTAAHSATARWGQCGSV
jgi:hypothetical protein